MGALLELIALHRVTRLVLVPALLPLLAQVHGSCMYPHACWQGGAQLDSLKVLSTSGGALNWSVAGQLTRVSTLLNLYGSTELAADVSCFELAQQPSPWPITGVVPIGALIVVCAMRPCRPGHTWHRAADAAPREPATGGSGRVCRDRGHWGEFSARVRAGRLC